MLRECIHGSVEFGTGCDFEEVDDSVRLPGNRLVRLHRWLNGNELTDLYQAHS